MRSLTCRGRGVVEIVDVPDPVIRNGDALVRIESSAVCGSERRSLLEGMAGNSGHEACGIVVDPGAAPFLPGDRVGLSAVSGCGACPPCREGRQLHCRDGWRPSSTTGWHAEFAAVRPDALYRIPDGVGPEAGVLLTGDSLGVPVRAGRRVPTLAGEEIIVIGLGPVGLGHVLVRAFEGATVVAIEPSRHRRALGLRLGALTALDVDDDIPVRPRLVIECTGRPECIDLAFRIVDNGGTVLQSGECERDIPLNPSNTIIRREITYTGSWYFAREDYERMLGLFAEGLDIGAMATTHVDADDIQPAIDDFLSARTGKVVVHWTGGDR